MFSFFSARDGTIKDCIADLKTELEFLDARLKQKQKERLERDTKQQEILTKAQEMLKLQEIQLDYFQHHNQKLQTEIDQLKEQLDKMPKPCPRCGAPVRPTCGMSCASGGYYSD
jgi:predicted RNase H-like nuclease (RuvC/YqgF family)